MTKQKFNINFCKLCDTFLDVEPSLFTATLFVQLYWELLLPGALLLRKLLHYQHARAYKWKGSRHFRVPPGLCIKMRLSAQPLIWKWCFILMQIKLIFTRKVCTWPHFESEGFWNWEGAYFFKVHTQKVFFFTAAFSTPLLTFLISSLESKFLRQQSIEEIGLVTQLDDH